MIPPLNTSMETEGPDIQTLVEKTRHGMTYRMVRTNEDKYTDHIDKEYEFVLFIDGEKDITATELEELKWQPPWRPAFERRAKARIDGLTETRRRRRGEL
jgi:hypothetical protein